LVGGATPRTKIGNLVRGSTHQPRVRGSATRRCLKNKKCENERESLPALVRGGQPKLVRGARTSSARRQRGHLRHIEMSTESNNYETATASSPSGARSRPIPDADPLPLPLPLPEIADGVTAAFPLDGPIGLRLHRAVTALIRDHHLVAVSNRTHPKNVFVRPSCPELHRSSPHCPRPLKPDASRAMYARRVTSWVCLGRQQ